MPAGRPTLYSDKLADRICELIATHPVGLNKICEQYDEMPDPTTIAAWRIKYPDFSRKYLDAKAAQIDLTLETLDEQMDKNLHYYNDSEGNKRIDSPSATIAIAKANNAKWYASKIAPKIYGNDKKDDDENAANSLLEKILSGEITVTKK